MDALLNIIIIDKIERELTYKIYSHDIDGEKVYDTVDEILQGFDIKTELNESIYITVDNKIITICKYII
ncbi:hypothetical protein [Alkaliphilus sp. B6464]|uniref:hypothetical protein n=1 Tax=Alkaliphilus sp. B6464 TaxID=2731219 RepID=UPI001BA5B34C|nr:hypothetical protein [Alkaliphilus sp. B6464]QUH21930.1 hypothetical protein HYG84_18650 [Alkaliphilus sp. B6464]